MKILNKIIIISYLVFNYSFAAKAQIFWQLNECKYNSSQKRLLAKIDSIKPKEYIQDIISKTYLKENKLKPDITKLTVDSFTIKESNLSKRKFYNFKFKVNTNNSFICYESPEFAINDYNNYNTKISNKETSLFSNNIAYIQQDKDGYIWISSLDNGVCKIGADSALVFNYETGLPSNTVFAMYFDSEERLWLATNLGVCYIKNNKIYTPDCNEKFKSHTIRVTEDKKGNIWISTLLNGVLKYSDDKIEVFDKTSGLQGNYIDQTMEDSNGNIWFAVVDGGFCKYNGKEFTQFLYYNNQENIPGVSLFEDSEKNIWLGRFDKDIIKYKNGDFFQYSFIEKFNERIFDVQETKNGLWFCILGRGLVRLKNEELEYYNIENGFPTNSTFRAFIDLNENIWITTLYNGIVRFDNLIFSKLSNKYFNINNAQNIKYDNLNNLWFFQSGGLLVQEKKETITSYINKGDKEIIPFKYILDGYFDNENNLWGVTHDEGIFYFDYKKFHFYKFHKIDRLYDVQADGFGNIWFIADQEGLIKFKNNCFYKYNKSNGISSNVYKSLLKDSKGKLWACTPNNGIDIIENDSLINISITNGLNTNNVNCITEDKKNRIWIGTTNGINILINNKLYKINESKNKSINNIVEYDDSTFFILTNLGIYKIIELSNNKFISVWFDKKFNISLLKLKGSALKTKDNNILFTTYSGILKYNSNFDKLKYNSPIFNKNHIIIEENNLLKYNKVNNEIIISPNGQLKIKFRAIDWGFRDYIKYEYSLSKRGQNPKWESVDNNNSIIINNFKPGYYNFYLKANFFNDTHVILDYIIIVKSAWYQTIWFYITVLIIIILISFFIHRLSQINRINKTIKLQKIIETQTKIIEEEKKELEKINIEISNQNKIKDHLVQEIHHRVKNNLQIISSFLELEKKSLLDKNDIIILENIQSRISSIAMMHEKLYFNNNIFQLSIKQYLESLIKNLVNNFISQKNIDLELNIDEFTVNSNICISIGIITNEVITNSLKYAFINIEKPKLIIELLFNKETSEIIYTIKDNGPGINSIEFQKFNKIGLKLINIFSKQLNAINEIESSTSNGTTFKLKFKNDENSYC